MQAVTGTICGSSSGDNQLRMIHTFDGWQHRTMRSARFSCPSTTMSVPDTTRLDVPATAVPDNKASTASKTTATRARIADSALTALEIALGILDTLGEFTENVPYLGVVTGCIQKLINIEKVRSIVFPLKRRFLNTETGDGR